MGESELDPIMLSSHKEKLIFMKFLETFYCLRILSRKSIFIAQYEFPIDCYFVLVSNHRMNIYVYEYAEISKPIIPQAIFNLN